MENKGDMEFGESMSRPVVWESLSRKSTLVEPKSVGLKRGPSLTFSDQGPKIIAKKPPNYATKPPNSNPRAFKPKTLQQQFGDTG